MKTINCIQGSSEWFEARCGKVTASRVAAVLATLKRGGESETRRKLKMQIAAEIMTEKTAEQFVNAPMQWGNEHEPIARTEYEIKTGNDVRLVGFVLHPTIERGGASPDGLIAKDGLLEIKCPQTTTHIDYLIAKKVPEEYQPQIQWQLACTEREWCDFASFDPRMPKKHQLLIVRMQRDNERIAAMEKAVLEFLAEVDEVIERLELGDSFESERLRESIAVVQR